MTPPARRRRSSRHVAEETVGIHRELVERILADRDASAAPPQTRRAAFENHGLTGAAATLAEKVTLRPATVTDADHEQAAKTGLNDDQIWELVICAAVGRASRQYETALAALAEAVEEGQKRMRPEVLNSSYGLGTKALFKFVAMFSGEPMVDAAKLTFYRPDFYGTPMKRITHQAMRGDSDWTVGERELMAATSPL